MTAKERRTTDETSDRILRRLLQQQTAMESCVRELVVRESPTYNKPACDALCRYLAAEFEKLGGRVRIHRQKEAGNHLQADFSGARRGRPVLLLGHYDTVYDFGSLNSMPWRQEKGRLYGPGVFDMKGGIAQILFAIRALRQSGNGLPRPVRVLLVSDEEEGSLTSRAITEKLAGQCEAVLVCEPSGPGGAAKTARKGVGNFIVKVTGVSSHAGLDFEKGHNAIVELARQIEVLSGITDMKRGITLNVGVVRGGTRTNVVPSEAAADIDVRLARKSDGAVVERKIRRLRPIDRKCHIEVAGGINRPPMERTKEVASLFAKAQEIGRQLGFSLPEVAVGGGSDGNFTAGMGIPTLDGLGAVGEGAHAPHESIVAAELPRRAALLARLIEAL